MKRFVFLLTLTVFSLCMSAQTQVQARKILDKTASIVRRKGGASASFTIKGKHGNASGRISIKGNKFTARTSDAIVWFDGKTQWTYMKSSQEVNVSNPTEAQQQAMNPYKFITLYKNGFNLSMKNVASGWHQQKPFDKGDVYYSRQGLSAQGSEDVAVFRLDNRCHFRFQGFQHQ